MRRSPSRMIWKASSAYADAVDLSSAPENSATAPYQSAGSVPGDTPRRRCASASRAAPPAMFAAGSVRSRCAGMPVSAAALVSVFSLAGSTESAGTVVVGSSGGTRLVAAGVLRAFAVVGGPGDRGPGVREVHRAVAARDAGRAGVRIPAGLEVRHAEQHALRHVVSGGGRGEGPLQAGRCAASRRDGAAPSSGSSRAAEAAPPRFCGRVCVRWECEGRWRIRARQPPGTVGRSGACGGRTCVSGTGFATIRQSRTGGGDFPCQQRWRGFSPR